MVHQIQHGVRIAVASNVTDHETRMPGPGERQPGVVPRADPGAIGMFPTARVFYGLAMVLDTRSAVPARPLWRVWLSGWPAVVHLIADFLLAAGFLTVSAATVASILGVASIIGIPFVIALLALGMVLVATERWRIHTFTGRWLPRWSSRPPELPFWRRTLLDSRPWRAQLYLLAIGIWGLTGGLLVTALTIAALSALSLPALPEDAVSVNGDPLAGPWRWLAVVVALNALLILPLLARLLVQVDVGLGRLLISTGEAEHVQRLEARVDTLTQTRQAAVDSVDAERRRIERDLHDGPQQRLVAVAMDLGLARRQLVEDPAAVAGLLERAHTGAKEAIVEMRQVARGIHPPVLTDRGLDAALSALAARSPVPVSVTVDLPRRPAARLEAIAYFSVSEALTNVAKHSGAVSARVRVEERMTRDGSLLVASVTDDGTGGADPTKGSGLVGLRDRVAAVDGRVLLSSPVGGPTALTVELPMAMAGEQPHRTTPTTGPAADAEPFERTP